MKQMSLDLKAGRKMKKSRHEAHIARLQTAMAPDPTEWEFGGYWDAGEMSETCACGHSIRHVFELVRPSDGSVIQIGSTCVSTTVPWLMENGNVKTAELMDDARKNRKEWDKRRKELGMAEAAQAEAVAWGEWFAEVRRKKLAGEVFFYLPPFIFSKSYEFRSRPFNHANPKTTLAVAVKSVKILRDEAKTLKQYMWLLPEPPKPYDAKEEQE